MKQHIRLTIKKDWRKSNYVTLPMIKIIKKKLLRKLFKVKKAIWISKEFKGDFKQIKIKF